MKNFSKISDIVNKYKIEDKDKYISVEFQKYGYDLASELNDLAHKALYIKLAKSTPRILLENAKSFVRDATNARSKGRLFMWKLKELKKQTKIKT
jgi:hypothetical protein